MKLLIFLLFVFVVSGTATDEELSLQALQLRNRYLNEYNALLDLDVYSKLSYELTVRIGDFVKLALEVHDVCKRVKEASSFKLLDRRNCIEQLEYFNKFTSIAQYVLISFNIDLIDG